MKTEKVPLLHFATPAAAPRIAWGREEEAEEGEGCPGVPAGPVFIPARRAQQRLPGSDRPRRLLLLLLLPGPPRDTAPPTPLRAGMTGNVVPEARKGGGWQAGRNYNSRQPSRRAVASGSGAGLGGRGFASRLVPDVKNNVPCVPYCPTDGHCPRPA